MATVGVCIFSLAVKDTVTLSPTFAYLLLALFEAMLTDTNCGISLSTNSESATPNTPSDTSLPLFTADISCLFFILLGDDASVVTMPDEFAVSFLLNTIVIFS